MRVLRSGYRVFASGVDICVAFVGLLLADLFVRWGSFSHLRSAIARVPVAGILPRTRTIDDIVAACDSAAVAYVRTVKCLQRSAALTCVLRLHGIPARFTVGCRTLPFYSHAWVDVHGQAVREDPDLVASLKVLDQF